MIYIGTYTEPLPHVNGKAAGIYSYELDDSTGALRHRATTPGVTNPSFVALDPTGRFLYAVQELGEYDGQPGGAVSAFAVGPDGALAPLSTQLTHGAHPCYVSVTPDGRLALVANYSGATVAALPIAADGSLGPASAVVRHTGTPTHHDAPHPHSFLPDPAGRFLLAADCGLDRIYVYRADAQGALAPHDQPWTQLAPGAGPRHLAFHPGGVYLYCIGERSSTLTALAYDAASGALTEIQTLSTLPDGFAGRNACADVRVHPSGRFVYGSNRGHDSIAAFAIDEATGRIEARGHTPTGGRTPRNFAIDPGGRFLLAANQDSDTVVTFAIDQATGALSPTGLVAEVATPVCLCFS